MSLSLALTLLLGPAEPAPPSSPSVELRVTSADEGAALLLEQLVMRRLGDRLLEDGYRVVPVGEPAGVRVWVHLDGEGARIEARGVERRVETVPGGDPQIVALEIQQLTTALVDELGPGGEAPGAAVIVEIRADEGSRAEGEITEAREAIQAGLLDRGFALTRTPGAADLRLCVVEPLGEASVHVVEASQSCEDRPGSTASPVELGASPELRREQLLDGATRALRDYQGVRTSPSADEVEADGAIEGEDAPTLAATTPPPRGELEPRDEGQARLEDPHALALSIAAHGGMFARVGGLDFAAGLRLRAGRRRGIGGALELALVPSRAEALRVIEVVPTAALDWRVPFERRGAVALGVFAGAHIHRYIQSGETGERGVRVGPSAGAHARLAYLGARGLIVFGGVRGGWSGGQWIHILNGEPTWRRAGLVLGLELGLGFDLPVGGRR